MKREKGLLRPQKSKKFKTIYKVIGIASKDNKPFDVGTYQNFDDAKHYVDNHTSSNVSYYVHTNENRILYSSEDVTKGEMNA
jgi:hypothetical protein|tara:strand:- start:679 stop:924 length:246 start_codon:yes stop_codon:yes gene_type:complete